MTDKKPAFSMNFKPVREISAFSVDAITSLAKDYTLIGALGYSSDELTGYGNFAFHTKPVEGFNHHVFKDGENDPLCCSHHQEIYNDILPQLTKTEQPTFLAKQILSGLAFTEHYIINVCTDIANNTISEQYLKYIYDYIEYTCASFGVDGFGHQFYLEKLKEFVKGSNIGDHHRQQVLDYISLAEEMFHYSGFSNENHQVIVDITNRWINIFPFELGELAEIKKELQERPIVPVVKKNNPFGIGLLFMSNKLNQDVIQVLCETSEFLLENISSVYMFEKGLLTDPNKRKLDLLVSGRKHKLKRGYSTSDYTREAYLHLIEEWFNDEKEFLNEIAPLLKSLPEKGESKPAVPSSAEVPTKHISFSGADVLDKVFELLKGYFPDNEEEFKAALEGQRLEEPIVFPYSQNKLVEVFRRLKYNGFIPNKTSEIRDWMCSNFQFRFKRGQVDEIRPLNPESVWDILSKGKGEPTKRERISFENVEWLPYKSPLQLSRESESEQL